MSLLKMVVSMCCFVVFFSLCGCSTVSHPDRVYSLDKNLLIVLTDFETLNFGQGYKKMNGYYMEGGDIIFVRRSFSDPDLPDFETLGHEVWHALGFRHNELGVWYKNKE